MWIAPFLRDGLPYDPVKSFTPITIMMGAPCVLVVHPALPVQSVKELITLAKVKPGQLNYSAGTRGSAVHLAAELFIAMAGVKIVGVAYKGTSGAEVVGNSPEQAAAIIKSDLARMGKVIKDAGIRAD